MGDPSEVFAHLLVGIVENENLGIGIGEFVTLRIPRPSQPLEHRTSISVEVPRVKMRNAQVAVPVHARGSHSSVTVMAAAVVVVAITLHECTPSSLTSRASSSWPSP